MDRKDGNGEKHFDMRRVIREKTHKLQLEFGDEQKVEIYMKNCSPL